MRDSKGIVSNLLLVMKQLCILKHLIYNNLSHAYLSFNASSAYINMRLNLASNLFFVTQKIGDFGLAVWTGPGITHTRFCGNPDYMAP